jgi:3-deoxy-D-manno-octulosonic-acid transferase
MEIALSLRARLAAQKLMQPRAVSSTSVALPREKTGAVIWLRLASDVELPLYKELMEYLISDDPDAQILITVDGIEAGTNDPFIPTPESHPQSMDVFLKEWQPDLILWSGAEMPLALLEPAFKLSIPVINTQAEIDKSFSRKMRMFPSYYRSLFSLAKAVVPKDKQAFDALSYIGLTNPILKDAANLKQGSRVLPHTETDRIEVVKSLAGRPVWLAEAFGKDEVETVIKAHRIAAKLTHRLLLVLVADPEFTDHLLEKLESENVNVHHRSKGARINQDTHIYMVENRDNQGLWFRVVPLSFLGGFDDVENLTNPLNAASLGSAIVHGPSTGRFDGLYKELIVAGAAIQVNTAEALAEAVFQLSFPDKAANMAHAGWMVSSEGAEATDQLVSIINDQLYPELADVS